MNLLANQSVRVNCYSDVNTVNIRKHGERLTFSEKSLKSWLVILPLDNWNFVEHADCSAGNKFS